MIEVGKPARLAGRGVQTVFLALLALNLVWIARNCDRLRPVGRGDVAPLIVLPRVDGQGERGLAELRGKVVLIDFWATWCGPCERTIPALRELHEQYAADGFDVLSINEDEGPRGLDAARAYATRMQLPFPVVHDDGHAAELYKVSVFPTMVLVDRRGIVRQLHVGVISVDRLKADLDGEIRALLAEPAP